MRSRPTRAINSSSAATSMLPLNGSTGLGLARFGHQQIDRLRADKLDVGARGIEVRVVRHHVALLAHHVEQNALGRSPLVGGDYVEIAEDVLNRVLEVIEALAAGIALIALHHWPPIGAWTSRRTGICQQVDENIVGRKQEEVVVRGAQEFLALFAGGPADGFDALDAKWLDDRLRRHSLVSVRLYRSLGRDQSEAGRRKCGGDRRPSIRSKKKGISSGVILKICPNADETG